MLRSLALLLVAGLAAPAAASAAPFAELPFTPLGRAFPCAAPTGAPGELMVAADDAVRLLRVTPTGLSDAPAPALGAPPFGCPAAASRPDGTAVVAAITLAPGGRATQVNVALREGGAWSPAQTLPGAAGWSPDTLTAAISDRGDVLMAWVESRSGEESRPKSAYRVRVARRPAGGAFGAPATLVTEPAGRPGQLRTGMAAGGEAVLLWTRLTGGTLNPRQAVDAAIAPAGADFRPARQIGEASMASDVALAIAPDGRALAVMPDRGAVRVAERPPGGEFRSALAVAETGDRLGVDGVAAVSPSGAAVVGWHADLSGQAGVVMRRAPGPFGAPRIVQARGPRAAAADPFFSSEAFLAAVFGPRGELSDDGGPSLAVTARGDARLAWPAARRGGRRIAIATVPAAGGRADVQTLGGGLRDPAPVMVLPGADPAVAWTDDLGPTAASARAGDLGPRAAARADAGDRLHVAIPGAATRPDPPAPAVRLGRFSDRRPAPLVVLRLPVRCAAACDVRALAAGRVSADGRASLSRAGRTTVPLRLVTGSGRGLRAGHVKVRVLYGAPGARRPRVRVLTARLHRRALPRVARVLGLRAVRHGGAVHVAWRTDRTSDDTLFFVAGAPTRGAGAPPSALALRADLRRRFAVALRPAQRVEWVTVHEWAILAGVQRAVRVRVQSSG